MFAPLPMIFAADGRKRYERRKIIHILFIALGSAIAAVTALYLSYTGIPIYWLFLAAVGAACLGVMIDIVLRWEE